MGGRETSSTTDAVDVVLAVGGKVVVDDKGNLLDIDTTGEEVSGDENTGRSRTELLHDDITLSLLSMSPCIAGRVNTRDASSHRPKRTSISA
jgi:hypothetical protein